LPSVICRSCGLVWTDPRPSAEQVRAFYAAEYRLDYKGTAQPKPKHVYRAGKAALDRVRRIRPHLPAGSRILDLGAGGGEVVYLLRSLGFEAEGIEPNEGYARHAATALGAPVRQGFWQDSDLAEERMDALTMFHVAEHLESPSRTFEAANRWLRPGGVFVVEVPNVEATCQHPASQFHIGHLYHFNLRTMEALHRKAGFDVVETMVSPDGGNITVVSVKVSAPVPCTGIAGNYERVATILRGHTPLRHALSLHPYLRPVRKLFSRLTEYLEVRVRRDPKAILDELNRRASKVMLQLTCLITEMPAHLPI
jgi:2-polyprenyl-3-methyl-5-hydroxy-6-metoxy-1,4-benzoquinol methylase